MTSGPRPPRAREFARREPGGGSQGAGAGWLGGVLELQRPVDRGGGGGRVGRRSRGGDPGALEAGEEDGKGFFERGGVAEKDPVAAGRVEADRAVGRAGEIGDESDDAEDDAAAVSARSSGWRGCGEGS